MSPRDMGGPLPEDMGIETTVGRPTDADFEEIIEDNYAALLSRPRMREHYNEMKQNLEELAQGGGEPSLSPGWAVEDFQELLRRVNELESKKK